MSDTITIKLDNGQYNGIFGVASNFTGEKSKIAATKIMDIIRDKVQASAEGEKLPETISVDFPKKVLDGFYIGITEKVKDEKITTQDVIQLKTVCQILKMKSRFEKFVDAELESIPENTEAFDEDEITEPFDGE